MKSFLILMVFLKANFLFFAQDTTYFSEFELANQEYNKLSEKLGNKILLDRAIAIETNLITNLKSINSPQIDSKEWLLLYHAKNMSDKNIDLKTKTSELSSLLYTSIYTKSAQNQKHTIPIGVVDFTASNVKPLNYSNGILNFADGWVYDGQNPSDIFEENRYSASALLVDEELTDAEIRLIYDENFIIEENKKVRNIKISYAGQKYTLELGAYVDLTLNQNDSIVYFETVFDDNQSTFNSQKLKIKLKNSSEEKSLSFTPFEAAYVDYSDAQTANLILRYNILFGTCNTTNKIKKPILMLHGYRPPIQNGSLAPTLIELFHEKFNFKGSDYGADGFCELLAKNGYDVIICRIDPAHESIISGGKLMASFIKNVVEVEKALSNSKDETIVLGFSMGGQFLRSALMQMESQHFYNNEVNHHVRMWIPVDSPNEGGNIPLAHQWAARSLWVNTAGAPVFNIAYNGLLTQGSKEQLRYHFDGNHGDDGADHYFHPARINYLSILNNDFYLGESRTKFRGYPSATRNVAIAVGSNSDDGYSNLAAGQLTWSDDSHVFGLLSHKKWDVKLYAEKHQYNQLLFKRIVTRKPYFSSSTNILVFDHIFTSNLIEMDNCYGSYHVKIRETINDGLDWNSLLGFNDYDYAGIQVFVPTVSALAIKPSFWPTNMRYNLKTNGLMYNSFDLTDNGISNDFGYPHLGRPTDYNTLTPMDAIYCNDLTYEHITLIDDDNNEDNDYYFDKSQLITFLLNEIEPWYLDLQNQDLGKYARTNYTYQAKYRAKNIIKTGNNLSPKTPFGDYNVLPNADLDLEAGEAIFFKPGTHIQQGARVHAYMGYSYCEPPGLVKKPNEIVEHQNSTFEEKQLQIDLKDSTLTASFYSIIYPNPNIGTFTIFCDELENEIGELQLYNLQGILIETIRIQNRQEVKLNNSLQKNSLVIAKIVKNDIILCETKISIL